MVARATSATRNARSTTTSQSATIPDPCNLHVANMASGTKKLRIARNKKRYWRKGTRLDDVEQFLQDEYAEQSEGFVFLLVYIDL
ncbi:unnamed protein product [Toxocara canis]|uniref:MADS-box domain-containing protein n=1 Tax=Toxocara canis TaxID=6265 RepID=A0A183VHK2_TOXCA|nr:unnamed protein product [Toxocara canis]